MTRKNLIITLTPLGFAVLCDARAAQQRSRSRSSVRRHVSKRPTSKPFATQTAVSINTLKKRIIEAKDKSRLSADEAKNMVQGLSAVSQPADLTIVRNNLNMLAQKTIPKKKKNDTIARIKAVLNKATLIDALANQAQKNQAQQDTIKDQQDTIDQLKKDDTTNKDTIDQLTKEKEQWTKQLKDAESKATDDKDKIKRLERDIEDLEDANRALNTKQGGASQTTTSTSNGTSSETSIQIEPTETHEQIDELQQKMVGFQGEKEELQNQITKLEREKGALEARKDEHVEQLAQIKKVMSDALIEGNLNQWEGLVKSIFINAQDPNDIKLQAKEALNTLIKAALANQGYLQNVYTIDRNFDWAEDQDGRQLKSGFGRTNAGSFGDKLKGRKILVFDQNNRNVQLDLSDWDVVQ